MSLCVGVPLERGRQREVPFLEKPYLDQDNLRTKFLALNVDFSSLSPDPPRFKEAGAGGRERRLPSLLKSGYYTYRVGQKTAQFFVYLITSPNINRFSNFFYCQNQETICNKTVTTDPTTPQMCRYTTS